MTTSLLNRTQRAAAARVFDSESKRFSDLVRAADLDPSVDLRGKALRRIVIQPDEDMAGFDFTGCDLSGAVLRRVNLSDVILTDALLAGTDLRGATLPNDGLSKTQRDDALVGNLPAALKHGPNRLWPAHLTQQINEIFAEHDDNIDLFIAAQKWLNSGIANLAEHLCWGLLDWQSEILGENHAITLFTRHELALAILNQGRAAEAEVLFRALVPIREKLTGSEHSNTLTTRHELARAILDQGRAVEAEELFRALLSIWEKASGPEHSYSYIVRRQYSRAVMEQNRPQDAADLLVGVPSDGGYVSNEHICFNYVTRAFLADLQGDAPLAETHLKAAQAAAEELHQSSHAIRQMNHYIKTRTPGGAGGTTLWMISDVSEEG